MNGRPDPHADALPPAIRASAAACAFAAGDVVARQGEPPRAMYFLLGGELRLERCGRDGGRVVLQRVRRGWAAEASLFAARYHCDLVAGADTDALGVPVRAMRDAIERSPAFARDWIAMLSTELRRARGACERMSLRAAEQRVVHAIECDGTDGTLALPATLKDWAGELGLTHEALYRTLARMEAAGTLRRRPGVLVLLPAGPRRAV